MQIGLQLPEVERPVPWPEYKAMAVAAEDAGFDSLWVGDHLLYRDDGREERGPWDTWSVLAALAASTRRVRLGPLVACTAFARPGVLARQAAAVHEISGGRLVLGLGAGWNETEFNAFGIAFDHRAARFAESFEIIRRLLAGERVTFDGEFERVDRAVLLPRPASRPPIMIGSIGTRVLRTALPHADGWNAWHGWYGNTPDGFAAANERVSRLVIEAGREPAAVTRSATIAVSLEDAPDDRPHALGVARLSGSPATVAGVLREFRAAGVEEAILVLTPLTERAIRAAGAMLPLVTAPR